MKVTPEMMGKFEQCKSVEEMLERAKYEKFSLTMEQAQKLFDLFQSENVTDEKMEKVIGGFTQPVGMNVGAGIGGGDRVVSKGGAIYGRGGAIYN